MIFSTWSLQAQADLARIDAELAEKDPDYADRVGTAAIAAARFLCVWPDAGSLVAPGIRKWPIKDPGYYLFYRRKAKYIKILRVRHAKEDWRPL